MINVCNSDKDMEIPNISGNPQHYPLSSMVFCQYIYNFLSIAKNTMLAWLIMSYPFTNMNYTHYKVWDEITYTFPNFNIYFVEVCEWISNVFPRYTGHVITYPCWG